MSIPDTVDLDVYQGDRLEIFFQVLTQVFDSAQAAWIDGPPMDLTGLTWSGDVKPNVGTPAPTISFAFTITTPSNGQVLAVLTPAQTKLLTLTTYVYDIQATQDATHIETYFRGTITVTPEVTR